MSASSCTGYRPTSANSWSAWPTPASSAAPWCCWSDAPFVWPREHAWFPTLSERCLGGVADQWATVVAKWSTRQLLLRGRKFNFIILLKEKKIINTIKRLQTVTARHSLSLVWDAPLGKLKPECLHQPWNTTELNSPTLFRSEWKLNNPNSCFRNIKFRCLNSQFSCCKFFFFVNFHIFG